MFILFFKKCPLLYRSDVMVSPVGSGRRREGAAFAKHHIPAQSTSSMLARGTIEPRALEIATTCSCIADSGRKKTFTFPSNVFAKKKKNQKVF